MGQAHCEHRLTHYQVPFAPAVHNLHAVAATGICMLEHLNHRLLQLSYAWGCGWLRGQQLLGLSQLGSSGGVCLSSSNDVMAWSALVCSVLSM